MRRFFLACLAMLPLAGFAASESPSAEAVIDAFYRGYLAPGKHEGPTLSKAFTAAVAENSGICKAKAGTDVCGWGADGDPYLDAQEYNTTYESSGITVSESAPGLVRVMLNVYPSIKNKKGHYERTILYKMVQENGVWVVDDILYANGASARKSIRTENSFYQNLPASATHPAPAADEK